MILSAERDVPGQAFPISVEMEEPSESQVVAEIRRLDGRRLTMATLSAPDWSSLSIGGGAGYYNVCWTTADEEFYSLADPMISPEEEGQRDLVVGGQLGFYPRRFIVPEFQAITAALEFLHDGLRTTTLQWRKRSNP